MSNKSPQNTVLSNRPCSFCKKVESSADTKIWPFCSARCKSLDLGAWASGAYTIPVVEVDEELLAELDEETPE